MKILVLSDIHGNYPALAAIENEVRPLGCAHVLNAGDSTVYTPFPNETIDWLRANRVYSIRGNTDDKVIRLLKGKDFKKPSKPDKRIMYTSTAAALTAENRRFLLGLKKKKLLSLGKTAIGLFHGSPADHDEQLRELAALTACRVVVVGHSHSPFHRCVQGVHFINPGSAGRMFDGNPAASYALLELDRGRIEVSLHRCAYDVEAVVRALAQHRLPAVYAEMFRTGTKRN
jgi:putative phosphoesterase